MGSSNGLSALLPGESSMKIWTSGKDLEGNKRARTPANILDPGKLFTGGYHAAKDAKKAKNAAEAAEMERQANIKAGIAGVNSAFDSPTRQKQYGDFVTALRDQYQGELGRQRSVNERNLKFSLARGGLTGGSADRDSRVQLGEEFTKGMIGAEDRAQSQLGELKSQDENARNNLISMVQTGLDATTASQRANSTMNTNLASNRSRAMVDDLGDLFSRTKDVYTKQQEAAGFRAGQRAPIGSLYGSNPYQR